MNDQCQIRCLFAVFIMADNAKCGRRAELRDMKQWIPRDGWNIFT